MGIWKPILAGRVPVKDCQGQNSGSGGLMPLLPLLRAGGARYLRREPAARPLNGELLHMYRPVGRQSLKIKGTAPGPVPAQKRFWGDIKCQQ